jgi:uncharacterized protein (DUF924 family)
MVLAVREFEMDKLAQDILDFWTAAGPQKWFVKDDAFDQSIRDSFAAAHRAAARGEYAGWENSPHSALALLLLTDQFPRNMFRNSAHAFATDAMALNIAKRSLRAGHDGYCGEQMKQFFYMPLMHSEDISDQEYCVALCLQTASAENVKFARIHRDIIAKFGRFPHRNSMFGRASTSAEQQFLDAGGFAG